MNVKSATSEPQSIQVHIAEKSSMNMEIARVVQRGFNHDLFGKEVMHMPNPSDATNFVKGKACKINS